MMEDFLSRPELIEDNNIINNSSCFSSDSNLGDLRRGGIRFSKKDLLFLGK